MHIRQNYLNKIQPFVKKPVIKIITGMRRVGKSYFLLQIIAELEKSGVKKDAVLYINKESLDFDFIKSYADLDKYVNKTFSGVKGRKYLFIDEIQEIKEWEKAVVSFFAKNDFDIYITGSNAHLLSSEIATLLSGRYVEIPIYALSFQEFLQFRGDKKESTEKEFLRYLRFGGLPVLHHFEFSEENVYPYISSIYDTILLKDVISKHQIRNVHLLENITRFIFDNIGNILSAKKISDYLKSQKLRVGVETVQNYLSYLAAAYVINKVPRYDLKGKRILEIHEKYFLGDVGIRHAISGYRESDISGVLENIVYLELKRKGYKVFIGKMNDKEIDFIAEKERKRIYVQVAYLLASEKTINREFNVLRNIKDNYPKYVVSMDTVFGDDFEGIQRLHIVDFLLKDK